MMKIGRRFLHFKDITHAPKVGTWSVKDFTQSNAEGNVIDKEILSKLSYLSHLKILDDGKLENDVNKILQACRTMHEVDLSNTPSSVEVRLNNIDEIAPLREDVVDESVCNVKDIMRNASVKGVGDIYFSVPKVME